MHDNEAPSHEFMARALAVAARARRQAPPWPAVGCVLVRDGAIVGEGATGPFPTGPHAEPAALAVAGDRARGATAYVTLEPCDHHGNTPPCSEALIAAGVRRVVVALEDPDPRVAGRGVARLRAAGVDITIGVLAAHAARQLAAYLHQRRTGRPFVVAKIATSLDARVAAADGSSQWITGPEARADAHELRADAQAVVVGSGTALADRPKLTVRDVVLAPRVAPTRVLLDGRGRVAADGPLFDPELGPTLVVTTERAPAAAVAAWTAAGAKVEVVGAARSARGGTNGVDLDEVFALLGREAILQVLVEGGGTLLGAVLAGGYAQRLVTYVAPMLLGTRGAPGYALAGPDDIAGAARYELLEVTQLGPDLRLEFEVA